MARVPDMTALRGDGSGRAEEESSRGFNNLSCQASWQLIGSPSSRGGALHRGICSFAAVLTTAEVSLAYCCQVLSHRSRRVDQLNLYFNSVLIVSQ